MRLYHAVLLVAGLTLGLLVARPLAARPLAPVLEASVGGTYVPPDEGELQGAERLFAAFLVDGPGLATLAADEGFRVERPEPGLVVLQEAHGERRGRGLYASRPGAATSLVVEAPHRFFDRDTGDVARLLFTEGALRAGAWNTVPRWSGGGGIRGAADSQATTATWFVPFARALVRVVPGVAVVQIHGFTPEKRRTDAARGAGFIVSNGSRQPASWFGLLDAAFTVRFPGAVRCFPRSVDELGALGNTTAATLRGAGCDRFVHVEISRAWRRRLLGDSGARGRLIDALVRYVAGDGLALR